MTSDDPTVVNDIVRNGATEAERAIAVGTRERVRFRVFSIARKPQQFLKAPPCLWEALPGLAQKTKKEGCERAAPSYLALMRIVVPLVSYLRP